MENLVGWARIRVHIEVHWLAEARRVVCYEPLAVMTNGAKNGKALAGVLCGSLREATPRGNDEVHLSK